MQIWLIKQNILKYKSLSCFGNHFQSHRVTQDVTRIDSSALYHPFQSLSEWLGCLIVIVFNGDSDNHGDTIFESLTLNPPKIRVASVGLLDRLALFISVWLKIWTWRACWGVLELFNELYIAVLFGWGKWQCRCGLNKRD